MMTSGSTAYPRTKVQRDNSMPLKRERPEDAYGRVSQDPHAMVKTTLFEPQPPAMQAHVPCQSVWSRATGIGDHRSRSSNPPPGGRGGMTTLAEADKAPTARSDVDHRGNAGWPTVREGQGHRVLIVVVGVTPHQGVRESRAQGEGAQVPAAGRKGGVRDARWPDLPVCHPQESVGIRYWRAVCSETGMHRSGRGRRKRAGQSRTSPAAYSIFLIGPLNQRG